MLLLSLYKNDLIPFPLFWVLLFTDNANSCEYPKKEYPQYMILFFRILNTYDISPAMSGNGESERFSMPCTCAIAVP